MTVTLPVHFASISTSGAITMSAVIFTGPTVTDEVPYTTLAFTTLAAIETSPPRMFVASSCLPSMSMLPGDSIFSTVVAPLRTMLAAATRRASSRPFATTLPFGARISPRRAVDVEGHVSRGRRDALERSAEIVVQDDVPRVLD